MPLVGGENYMLKTIKINIFNFASVLILSLLVSCSSTQLISDLPGQEYSDHVSGKKLERELASVEDHSCQFIIRKIITSNSIEVQRKYSYKNISYTGYRFKLLNELEAKYKQVDSVLDFPQTKELPIDDAIKVVRTPEEGLLAKVMMIRNAKKSIDLTYFLFDQSEASKVLLHEIKEAALRGVKVRVLYDPIGSKMGTPTPRVGIPDDLLTLVSFKGRPIVDEQGLDTGKNAQIEVVQFNPSFTISDIFKKWFHAIRNFGVPSDKRVALDKMAWNNRIHDKILLIDAESPKDTLLITGGRNLSDPYYHLNHAYDKPGTMPVLDIEVIIKGTSGIDGEGKLQNPILDQFNRIYYARANIHLRDIFMKMNDEILQKLEKDPALGKKELKDKIRLARQELRQLREANRAVLGIKNSTEISGKFEEKFKKMIDEDYLNEGFENATINVLHEVHNLTHNRNLFRPILAVSKKENPNSIRDHIFEQFANATKTIDIVSPYFWIDSKETKQLAQWLSEDPTRKLRIISNSILSTDNIISQTVVENAFERIEKIMKAAGVWEQVDLRVIGKEDHELLVPNGQVYGFLHGKVYITDRKNVVVSTSNLDPISRDINSEIGVSFKFKEEDSKNLKEMLEFVEFAQSISTNIGSQEYQRMISNPKIKNMVRKTKAAKWIVEKLGLLHLL